MDQNDLRRGAFTRQQKTGFVLLLIFGILSISLGVLQLRNKVYGPFSRSVSSNVLQAEIMDPVEKLKNIDTDHDGLVDYDEIYVYHTSSYIADTDSDGISDKQEIEKNSDPLCNQLGGSCGGGAIISSTESPTTTDELIGDTPISNVGTAEDIVNQTIALDEMGAFADFKNDLKDPAKVREMLISTGKISKDVLSKIDDNTLMLTIGQILVPPATNTPVGF